MKPLIERMAEALEANTDFIGAPPANKFEYDSLRKDVWVKGKAILAEYRNRSPEISQETAMELYRSCLDALNVGEIRFKTCALASDINNRLTKVSARAEAELKGRPA